MSWLNALSFSQVAILVLVALLLGGGGAVAVSEYRLHKRTQRHFRINRQWTVGRDVR